MSRRLSIAGGLLVVLLARAAAEPPSRNVPIDPYATDPAAPVVSADQARGWELEPRDSSRPAVEWVKRRSRQGLQLTARVLLAPFEGVLKLDERFAIVRRIEDLLYTDDRMIGIVPSFSSQSGFGSSIGAQLFHKNVWGHAERVAAKVSYGGRFSQEYQLSLDLPRLAGRFYVEGLARYEGLSKLYFHGFGHGPTGDGVGGDFDPRAISFETQYRQRRALGLLGAGTSFGRPGMRLRTGVSAIYNVRYFSPLDLDDPRTSIEEVYDTDRIPSFREGSDILELTLEAVLDTRDLAGRTGSGSLLEVFLGGAPSLDGNLFAHYGLEYQYFKTLFRESRVVVLRVALEGVAGAAIPFTELPRIGGSRRLRGYVTDRFTDRLAAIGTIEYRYPIHHLISGVLFVDTGRVAKSYPELTRAENWQLGVGAGVLVHTLEDLKLRFDVAYGDGFQVLFTTDALAAFRGRKVEL